jgi:phosphatidylserine/phosphatidylglycerophosphate/cardiolipin synthase-like enzyme
MTLGFALEAFVGRQLDRALAPLHRLAHGRHADMIEQERQRLTQQPRDEDAWWAGEPRWYPDGTPPRRYNRVTPLIDGAHYLPTLRQTLADAQSYVYIAGWCLTPLIPLDRADPPQVLETRLLDLLAARAQRIPVRILLWSGAPALIQPTIRQVRAVQREVEAAGGNMQCRLDHTAPFTHCHHQKAVVIDGQHAFVGGMDLTTFQGDRWDHSGHPLRGSVNWHDVQLHLEGEIVADVEHNFRQRWTAVTGDGALPHRDPEAAPGWDVPAQIVRTIPKGEYPFAPAGEHGIHHAFVELFRRAERLVYIENQYLWAPAIMAALEEAVTRPHAEPFRIVIVLPARAYSGKWDNDRHVERLRKADGGRGIVSVYCPYASGLSSGVTPFTYRPVYVHAKVAIVDDEWTMVGSANLNDRGLATDSEIDALVHYPMLARDLRLHLWAEHLAMPLEEVAQADIRTLADHVWPERAAENRAIIERENRPLPSSVIRYETGHMPGSWLLEETELLTFEH